jgi:hypothetical protein
MVVAFPPGGLLPRELVEIYPSRPGEITKAELYYLLAQLTICVGALRAVMMAENLALAIAIEPPH